MTSPGDGAPLFRYPLEYPIKVFGLAGDDFAEYARRLVERVAGPAPAEQVTVRASSGGKYHAVTIIVTLTSESQRLALYDVLRDDPRVVHAL
jgi:putative lipoic acid-binding regulatory protein